jgi:ABC-2 type transport system permease protein
MGMKKFISLVGKENRHILRDRWTMAILLIMPVVQILLFGFAISTKIRNIRVEIITEKRSEALNRFVSKLDANDYFIFKGYLNESSDIDSEFRKDKADMILHIKGNLDNMSGDPLQNIEVIADASNPSMAASEQLYSLKLIRSFFDRGMKKAGKKGGIHVKFLYNPQLDSAYNFVPGIMGLILMMICAMMTSISIVKEKETGTMELLLVSPTTPLNLILAKMVPYFMISCINLATIMLLSVYLLGVPVSGSLIWLCVVSVLYIFLALAIGLLVSTVMDSQLSAMLLSVAGLILPTILLSGMVFPIENSPAILQWLSCLVPARWYISAVRKLMIEGLSVRFAIMEISVLAGMALVVVSISLKNFKNRLA